MKTEDKITREEAELIADFVILVLNCIIKEIHKADLSKMSFIDRQIFRFIRLTIKQIKNEKKG